MYCDAYRALIPDKTCLLRYREMKEWTPEDGTLIGRKSYPRFGACRKCETGRKNFERYERGDIKLENKQPRKKGKACSVCGEFRGLSMFGPDKRTVDGKKTVCLECEHQPAADQSPGKKKTEAGAASKPVEKPENSHALTLDFSRHQELIVTIKEIARQEFRTPEMQVMYWLDKRYRETAVKA